MEIKCKTQEYLPIHELTEFQGSLKKRTDKDYEKIEKSIKKHGFSFPFFVWKNNDINYVLDGHGRLGTLQRMVAKGEQLPALPVVYVDCKDEADAKELLLKLNSQYGIMTQESVQEFLGDLEINFEDLAIPDGFMDFTPLQNKDETVNDDETPEVDLNETPDSQYGMVYELGNHKLMCGDSTKEEDIAILMGENKADLIVTDPPYNVDYVGKTKDALKIQNDKMENNSFLEFLTDAFTAMFMALKQGGVYYIWHADIEGLNFRQAVKNCGGLVHQCLIWVKNSMVLGRQDYQWKHEPCLYGWKEGAGHYWEGSRKQTTVIEHDRPTRSELHPTMKPVGLFEYLIKNSSKAEDIVLDPFGGSGTTIIAAEKQNRHARVMELDPHYCDVIRKRWTQWAKDNGVEVGAGGLE